MTSKIKNQAWIRVNITRLTAPEYNSFSSSTLQITISYNCNKLAGVKAGQDQGYACSKRGRVLVSITNPTPSQAWVDHVYKQVGLKFGQIPVCLYQEKQKMQERKANSPSISYLSVFFSAFKALDLSAKCTNAILLFSCPDFGGGRTTFVIFPWCSNSFFN